MPRRRLATLLVGAALAVTGCGEPAVDLDVPRREAGQHVLDEAGLLDDTDVADRLAQLDDQGLDVVAVTYETERASKGESSRAARLVLEEWGADVALVAVAAPGDFTSTDEGARGRYFGLESADRSALPRSLRERIAEERAPSLAADNDWPAVFSMAIDELEGELGG